MIAILAIIAVAIMVRIFEQLCRFELFGRSLYCSLQLTLMVVSFATRKPYVSYLNHTNTAHFSSHRTIRIIYLLRLFVCKQRMIFFYKQQQHRAAIVDLVLIRAFTGHTFELLWDNCVKLKIVIINMFGLRECISLKELAYITYIR